MMNSRLLIIAGVAFVIIGIVGSILARRPTITTVRLAGTQLTVQHADTPKEQARGLMGWCALLPNQGMLFDFASESRPTFWMKGMRIPIDIVWIRQGEVVSWQSDAQPDRGKTLYPAPGPIDHVLELPAGWATSHGLTIGSAFEESPVT